MNILFLTHSYPDNNNSWRGSFIKEQAIALSSKYNVVVVFFKIDNARFAPFADYSFSKTGSGNLTEYTVTISRSFPLINQLKYLQNTYRFITTEILHNFKPDLIHSHLSYPAGFLGTILKRRTKIPVVVTEHSRIRSYFRSWFHKKCIHYTLKNASAIIAVSNSLKEEIYSVYSRSVNVVYNIIDASKFRLVKTKQPGKLNIGFLGGLGNNNKGLDLLIESARMLTVDDYTLHIGGSGPLLDYYKRLAKEKGVENRCRFYGEILRCDIPSFYSRLDLFVLASRYETFGVVLIEAMASGIPVIATKCGGPEEIVVPLAGILIEKDNPEALARNINEMSGNLGSYKKEMIRAYAEEKFGKKTFIENISLLYEDILKKPK